jgi:putative membrane protein
MSADGEVTAGGDVTGRRDVGGGPDVTGGADMTGGAEVNGGAEMNGGPEVNGGLDMAGGRDVAGAGGQADIGWLRLSPRSLVVRPAVDLIRLLPVLLGVLYLRSRGGSASYWGLGFAALAIVSSIVRWFTTRYRITEERVYLRRGLLNQKILSVARDRVRSVDLTAHLLYRMLGLSRVSIGTGRNDRREGGNFRLDALTRSDAEALRERLLTAPAAAGAALQAAGERGAAAAGETAIPAAGQAAGPAETETETELARLHPGWVRFAPLTLTGMVIVGVLLGFLLQLNDEAQVNLAASGPVRRLSGDLGGLPLGGRILAVAVAVLLCLVLISTAGYVALFWNFRLTRLAGGALRVTRGLLSTRATTIDAQRLRGIEISEPLLLRTAGGARCIAITTGLRVGRGAERGGSLILPPAPRAVARATAAGVLGVPGELVTSALVRHGPRARLRRYTRAVGGAAVIAAAVIAASLAGHGPAWIWLLSLALLPLAALLAADRYRSLGHALTGGWLVTRTGSLLRRRSILSTEGIIGWRIHQSWFQRRQGLVTLTATTAAGRQHYDVRDVPAAEALAVAATATPGLAGPLLRQ